MKHLYLLLTLFVLFIGAVSISYVLSLYRQTRISFLKYLNLALVLLNYQIFCGLIFDYYIFNLFSGKTTVIARILGELYLFQLSVVIVLFCYFLIQLVYIAWRRPLAGQIRKGLIAFFSTMILIQLAVILYGLLDKHDEVLSVYMTAALYLFYLLLVFGLSVRLIFSSTKTESGSPSQAMATRYFGLFLAMTTFLLILFLVLRYSGLINQDVTNLLSSVVQIAFNLFPLLYLKPFLQRLFPAQLSRFGPDSGKEERLKRYRITAREAEIIELICRGYSNKEIEEKLFISIRTVKDHIYNIYRKTGLKNRVQLSNLFKDPDRKDDG